MFKELSKVVFDIVEGVSPLPQIKAFVGGKLRISTHPFSMTPPSLPEPFRYKTNGALKVFLRLSYPKWWPKTCMYLKKE